jgi:hypothetical protein
MIITLCGSNRFEPWFHSWSLALGLSGHVPIGLCSYPSNRGGVISPEVALGTEGKGILDETHKKKIDASDAIFVLNVFAYIGDSTMSEIKWAQKTGKKIFFLESFGKGCGLSGYHSVSYIKAQKAYNVPFGYVSPIDATQNDGVWDLLPPAGKLRTSIVDRLNKDREKAMERK